jgi:hypothetical protein
MRHLLSCLFVASALAAPALAEGAYQFPADPDEATFIGNEVLAAFYHELGHGLIHTLSLPVLGKEEDAADTMSVIMMNDTWDEADARSILTSDATAFALAAADQAEATAGDFADVHSLNIQRYFTVVCLFYGANPTDRAQLARDLELPEDRMASCPDDWQQTEASWNSLLADAEPGPDKKGLEMAPGQDGLPLADLLAGELATINAKFGLPVAITVKVADCGEANAFFDPADTSITMCNEYAAEQQRLWEKK